MNKKYSSKTYLELDERMNFSCEGVDSIIGYYEVTVPRLNTPFTNINLEEFKMADFEILKQVRKTLSKDIERVETDKDVVKLYCYKGSGDYVAGIEDIYALKNEIEEKVKLAMDKTDIYEYTLIIHVTTLFS